VGVEHGAAAAPHLVGGEREHDAPGGRVAAERGDLVGYVEADHVFHLTLLGYSRNRFLVDVVADLRSQTRLFGLAEMAEQGTLASSAAEHLALVDLIAARDAEGAGDLMSRHIGRLRAEWAGSSS
jgi:DNA-binding GntR family transcriptional regulator